MFSFLLLFRPCMISEVKFDFVEHLFQKTLKNRPLLFPPTMEIYFILLKFCSPVNLPYLVAKKFAYLIS